MTPKLSGPMLPPRAGGRPKSIVVLLHGYGSDGADLIGLGQIWAPAFPHTLFVAPNGPAPCPGNPSGYQWFPLDFENPARRIPEARAAGPGIEQFLAELWAQSGLSAADTVLAGFSQGAMMALQVGLGSSEKLAGILAFSGALIPREAYSAHKPPVLLLHGELDNVVDAGASRRAEAELRGLGYDVAHHVSPGIGHSISPEGLDVASAFLKRVLPA